MENKVRYKLHKVKKQWVTLVSLQQLWLPLLVVVLPHLHLFQQKKQKINSNRWITLKQVQPNSRDRAAAVEVEAKTETTAKPEVALNQENSLSAEVATNAGLATPTAEKSNELEAEIKAAVSLDNIKKEKDGKYYYLLEDGSHKKNFAITVNGQVLYFDENGALSSTSTYSFTQETTNLVTDFTKNNAAYDSTVKSKL